MDRSGVRGWAGRPLLPAPAARRWAWALLACCVAIVVALGLAFAHHTAPDGLDRALDDPVIRSLGSHRTVALWLSRPGTQIPALVISLAMAVACLRSRRLNGVVLALTVVLVATGVDDWFLKSLVGRTYLGALTYPSGHTTSIVAMTATYVVLFLLPPQEPRTRRLRWGLLVVLLVLVIATVLGVMALQWHYFTDTIGGAAVAVGTVCGLCLLLDAVRLASRPRGEPRERPGRARSFP